MWLRAGFMGQGGSAGRGLGWGVGRITGGVETCGGLGLEGPPAAAAPRAGGPWQSQCRARNLELAHVDHPVVDAAQGDQVRFRVRTAVLATTDVVEVEPQPVRAPRNAAVQAVPVEYRPTVAGGIDRVT